MEDRWFLTFTFPMAIRFQSQFTHGHDLCTGDEKIKEWLRRLRQTLRLKEDEIFYSYFPAEQQRGTWHVHMEIKAEGLSELSQQRWEEKWSEITGRKVVEEVRKYETVRVPGVIRRRSGCPDSVTYIREPWSYVVDENVKFVGGGTCKIRQVGQRYVSSRRKKEYICSVDGFRWYLGKRHSNDMKCDNLQKDNHTFLGIL